MDKIPVVLRQFVETHEEDGRQIEFCGRECQHFYEGWHNGGRAWFEGGQSMRCIDGDKHAYCLLCGTLVGFLSDGTPYRIRLTRVVEALEQAQAERDHLRRALEWLAGHDRTNKDCPPEPYNDEDPTPEFPQEKAPEGTVCWDVALECVRCWCRAALAATKEAT